MDIRMVASSFHLERLSASVKDDLKDSRSAEQMESS
jgi:hypothetical protein